jgi:hypothetical protein
MANVSRVADTGGATVAGEEPCDSAALTDIERVVVTDENGSCGSGHEGLLDDPTSHRGGNQACFSQTLTDTERTCSGRSAVAWSSAVGRLLSVDMECLTGL